MKCPACETDLAMAERQGIEIDYCPKCRGVWLDRGELDKIIERSTAEIRPPDSPVPSGGYDKPRKHGGHHGKYAYGHDKYGYGKRRRKSVLGEIFDIFD